MREAVCPRLTPAPLYPLYSFPFSLSLSQAGLELNDLEFLGLLLVPPLCLDARCALPHLVCWAEAQDL